MATIAADKEVLWRQQSDEYAVVLVKRIIRIIDDEGIVSETIIKKIYTPYDDISELPSRLQIIIQAARYPEAVARFDARAAQG